MLFHMCAISIRVLQPGTLILLFPWKLAENGKYEDCAKICESILLRFPGGLASNSQSFMVKLGLKVRNSRFPWQPFRISKFKPPYVAL